MIFHQFLTILLQFKQGKINPFPTTPPCTRQRHQDKQWGPGQMLKQKPPLTVLYASISI